MMKHYPVNIVQGKLKIFIKRNERIDKTWTKKTFKKNTPKIHIYKIKCCHILNTLLLHNPSNNL